MIATNIKIMSLTLLSLFINFLLSLIAKRITENPIAFPPATFNEPHGQARACTQKCLPAVGRRYGTQACSSAQADKWRPPCFLTM
jgi:hypothetical protein